jgi:hypothetical protein
MANIYKNIPQNRIVKVQNIVNESIPITGTILSGTYSDNNVKYYAHRMFQSVYDYPYLSASSNKLMDISCGYSSVSALSSSSNTDNDKKILIYNEMAKVLMGTDITGTIQRFDEDGNVVGGGTKLNECFFISFTRLLSKDEIKKGSFAATFFTGGTYSSIADELAISDSHATTSYFSNAAAGEWSYLKNSLGTKFGAIFYQAGIVVLTASMFSPATGFYSASTINQTFTGTNISGMTDAFRRRVKTVSFLNSTKINSSIVFCDVLNDEFNYSSNPTYLTGSKIRTKINADDPPVVYVTGIELYSPDNEVLARAKLSEPIRKTPSDSYVLKVRADF